MPEYLHPGVFVTEVALGAKPIEGVSTSTADVVGGEIIGGLQRLVRHPDWTEQNESDPGIALLELCAWLAESLAYRTGQIPEHGALHAARLAAAALALTTSREQPCGSVLKKVCFFEGRLLNEDDLRTEQEYLRPRPDRKDCATPGSDAQ